MAPTRLHEDRVAEFVALVDCDPNEVLDAHERWGHLAPPSRQDVRQAMSDFAMPFGKHQGKPLRDVPVDYLWWLLTQPKPSRSLRQVRPRLEVELARRDKARAG